MDEFFEIPEINPEPERGSFTDPPAWVGPPADVIAVLVADRRLLARTDRLAVLLDHIDAFPTGASLRLRIMARWSPDMSEDEWRRLSETVFEHGPGGRRSRFADEVLRVGVQFADKRKATNLDHEFGHPRDREVRAPSEPSLVEQGSGGSIADRFFVQGRSLWLWPLPPPEPFDLVIEWPALGIPATRTSIDGAVIVAAAQGTEPAWLDPRT